MNDYRVFAVDGSTFSIPYDKDSAYALKNRPGRPRKDGGELKYVF